MSGMPLFKSPFANLLREYVAHRRMRGYKPKGEYCVRQFDIYAAASPIATEQLTKELVQSFIARRTGEKPSTQHHRVSAIRCFAKYLVRRGIDAYILPYGILAVEKYSFVPYVFRTEEVVRLMAAADLLPYCASSPRRHIVIPMMLRLIYGLRSSNIGGY